MSLAEPTDGTALGIMVAFAAGAGLATLIVGLSDPLTVPDDARQFVFWMAEWREERLFRGDLVADYWRSVSPWLFTAVYRALDLVGIEPLTAARILPVILYPATTIFAFRFARTVTSDAGTASIATFMVLLGLVADDSIASATPRAFAPLFFLMSLDGLARRSLVELAVGLFCLGGIYPHLAIVGTTVSGVALVAFDRGPRLDFARKNLVLIGVGAAAAVAGVMPLLLESSQFGPTVTPESAGQFATFGPEGRTQLYGPDGRIDYACGPRIGLVSWLMACGGFTSLSFWTLVGAVLVPPLILFLRHARSQGRDGSPMPLAVVLVGAGWFAIAVLVAFRLHLPNRFVLRSVPMMWLLSVGVLLGDVMRVWLSARAARVKEAAAIATSILGLVALGALILVRAPEAFATWKHPRLGEAIASLPAGTVVAGFVSDTDYVPTFAKRRVLFSIELAVGYHLGYYRQIEARMRDMAEVELTADAAVIAERLAQNAVDVYLVEAGRLADRRSDRNFAPILGDFVEQKRAELGAAPTALSQLAPPCRRGTFDGVDMLDAQCLIAAARQ